jgi:bifunctional ADP-heptose synthase (sugar kinase/adenylyltransferase)
LYDETNLETEATLDTIIKCVDPEYWVKGSDYSPEKVLAKHPTLRNIAIVPNIPEKSTTKIIQKIYKDNTCI